MGTYLCFLPVLPGVFLGVLTRGPDWLFIGVAALATLAILALAARGMVAVGSRWPWLAIGISVVSGAQAMLFATMLRM